VIPKSNAMSEAVTDTDAARPTTVGSLVAARRTLSEMARTPDWARATQLAVSAERELAAAEGSATASSGLIVPVGAVRLHMVEALGSMKTRRGREGQVLEELTRIQEELNYVIGVARAGAGGVSEANVAAP
jgi:hypothetical protein